MGERAWRTVAFGCGNAVVAATTCASAQGLPGDTFVRVRNPSPGAGWLEGRIGVAPSKCTLVFLKGKAPGGYASMALNGVEAMQKRDGAGWTDVDVKPWLAKKPKDCRAAYNDRGQRPRMR